MLTHPTRPTPTEVPLPATMRAMLREEYGPAEVLRLREVPLPTPSSGQVRLKVSAAGLDRAAWHLMVGRPYLLRAVFGLRRPHNPRLGLDVAGVVQAVGPGVADWRVGDRVFGVADGAFAEYAVARADKLARVPAGIPLEQAASVPISGLTALHALRDHGRLEAGQRVLILGASGGVGSFAVQLARAWGGRVTGVCSAAKLEWVRSLGAETVLDYARTDPTDGLERYDLIVDIGGNRPLSRLRRALTPTGTLVIVGGEHGDPWSGGMGRVLAAQLPRPFSRQRLISFYSSENRPDLETLAALLKAGTLVAPIERMCALVELPQAMRDLEAGRVRGKVVISLSAPSTPGR